MAPETAERAINRYERGPTRVPGLARQVGDEDVDLQAQITALATRLADLEKKPK
jgi:hypothetical protein